MKWLKTLALATTVWLSNIQVGYGKDGISFTTGPTLLQQCLVETGDNNNAVDWGICHGYITAIAEASTCGDSVFGYSWKFPENVTPFQLKKVVVKWLNDHPERLNYSAADLVAQALQEAFPCD